MADENQKEAYTDHVAQIVYDFMQLKARLETFLPEELVHLKNRLDEMSPQAATHRAGNYELFYRVSRILYRKNNPTMGELSSALSVPLSTATRMVDWLVNNGYAARLPDPEDRRIVRVALTDTGHRLHEIAERYLAQRVQQVLSGLTAKERGMLFALLRKIVSTVKRIKQ